MLKVNPEHKISICVPYKAGSETWRYLMESLSNSTETLDSVDQLQDYMKAIQVRDPYERLLSGSKERMCNLGSTKRLLEAYAQPRGRRAEYKFGS